MFDTIPDSIKESLGNAGKETKELLADILANVILSSSIPEESKIEVRIMLAYRELDDLLSKTSNGFAAPIPPTEAGEKFQEEAYPTRKEFLEYLQLMKVGLDSFLAANPVPEIPPEVRSDIERFSRS